MKEHDSNMVLREEAIRTATKTKTTKTTKLSKGTSKIRIRSRESRNNNKSRIWRGWSTTLAVLVAPAIASWLFGFVVHVEASRPSFMSWSADDSSPTLDEPFQPEFKHLTKFNCVSLMTRDGREGCSTTSRDTSTGMLLHWSVSSENWSSNNLTFFPPFVAVVSEDDFTTDAVDELLGFASSATTLRGILVLNSTLLEENIDGDDGDDNDSNNSDFYTSPAAQSPQGQTTSCKNVTPKVNGKYAWNYPHGTNLLSQDLYGIPAAYVDSSALSSYLHSTSILQASRLATLTGDLEDLYPAIVVQFDLYMGPEKVDTPTCLAWKDTDGDESPKCAPLGGNSVWASAGSPPPPQQQQQESKPIVLLATNLDSTSMFHDLAPGANTAASNILALLMAAKLVREALDDDALDALSHQIVFAFFQGEAYGYIGSRRFLLDVAYPGFQCEDGGTVPSVASASVTKPDTDVDADADADAQTDNGTTSSSTTMACLNPLRPDLDFMNLGDIRGMITVDQVGVLSDANTFYVHSGSSYNNNNNNSNNGDYGMAEFMSNVMQQMSYDSWNVQASSVQQQNANDDDDDNNNNNIEFNNGVPLPPTPLTSLMTLSEGTVGGAVLTGYDTTFADHALYLSHLDSNSKRAIDLDAVAAAATVLARTALAAASSNNAQYNDNDDDNDNDAATAAAAAIQTIPELDAQDEQLVQLAECLLQNGDCDLLVKYGSVERANLAARTGVDLGMGSTLGHPPSYYTGIMHASYGQPFVQVSGRWFGAYSTQQDANDEDADDEERVAYGDDDGDAFLLRPSLLEMAVHGLLNDYLGRAVSNADGEQQTEEALTKCQSTKDCSGISYCSSSSEDSATCTGGGVCVCSRAHYHLALDEAIAATPNKSTGHFHVVDDDTGVSAMYSEPYWSNSIGVMVYRDGGAKPGNWVLGSGMVVASLWVLGVLLLRRRLTKEKLY